MPHHDCRAELHAAGSRATSGRLALLKVLEHARRPFSVAELKRAVRVNEVTLYRALDALTATGLVRRGVKDRVARYEYAAKPHHHHLVCVECGFTRQCAACA